MLFHLMCAAVLVPVASHPYDLAVLTGNAQAWLTWGFTPFYNWKFGLDYAGLTVLAQALRAFLSALGVSGIVAIHVAWKLPLVTANLLSAAAIYRLALKFVPDRAAILSILWLVNPAVLWISAGHGQIESVSVLCVFAAMLFALDGRLLLAGIVTGLGAGIEYYPIAVLGTILVWWRGGYLPGHRPLPAYAIGLMSALAICFGPLALDPVARSSLAAGLATSSGLAAPSQSLLSIWAWLNLGWAPAWPALFLIGGITCFAVCWLYAARAPSVGVLFLAFVLMLAVLLDANALALFSLIAAAGLWLLAMAVPVQPLGMVLLPTVGASTALLYLDFGTSTANAYFYDDWAATGAKLWPVPQSEVISTFLGHLFSIGLIAIVIYALARGASASRRIWTTSTVIGVCVCALLVIWASQPAIWRSAFSASPTANLPDFQDFVASRSGSIAASDANTLTVSYSDALVLASRQSAVLPSADLTISMQDLYNRIDVGKALPPLSWPDRNVSIPRWGVFRNSIQYVWVEVLLGSPDWSTSLRLSNSGIALDVNQATVYPDRMVLVATQPGLTDWALVDFRVPASTIDLSGNLKLLPKPISAFWNGSDSGPWVRVVPAAGAFNAVVNGGTNSTTFELDASGRGYALELPVAKTYQVKLDRELLPGYRVTGAVLRWPHTPEMWMHDVWFQALGATYGLLLALMSGYLLRLALNTRVWRRAQYFRSSIRAPVSSTATGRGYGPI